MMDADPYKNYPAQNYPTQSYPAQNYPPQNYPPQNYPPQNGRMNSSDPNQQQFDNTLNLQLTPEELAVVKECQHNAIFHRGLPVAAVATGGFHYMMTTGMIKKNIYTLIASGISGFFIGTMSYRSICMEKLMALPNSTLKDRILATQGIQPVKVDLQSDSQIQPWVNAQPHSSPPSAPMSSALDIEPYHSYNDSYSNPNPIDPESAFALNPPLKPAASDNYTNYDELRRRNREEYGRGQDSRPQSPPPPPSSTAFDGRFDRPFEPPTYNPPRQDDFL